MTLKSQLLEFEYLSYLKRKVSVVMLLTDLLPRQGRLDTVTSFCICPGNIWPLCIQPSDHFLIAVGKLCICAGRLVTLQTRYFLFMFPQ